MLENDITTITKKDAMNIGSKFWREVILGKITNIDFGLRAGGLWHFSFPAIQCRLKLFKDSGAADSEKNPTWMRYRETFRTEVLSLPPAVDRLPHSRQTIDSNNRLFSREQLIYIDP